MTDPATQHPLLVAIADRPSVEPLKAATRLGGRPVEFPRVMPIYKAFARMIGEQAYEAGEIAITAFLQARAAGRPLLLLPVVLAGVFHHKSLLTTTESSLTDPSELRGGRIGVRSLSQTTGLWVRGWLAEQYGVGIDDVTWVTTEGSHVAEFEDPEGVERTENSLEDELLAGNLDAVIQSRSSTPGIRPLLPDPAAAAAEWYARHRLVPVNHLVAVTEDFAGSHPEELADLYGLLVAGLDRVAADRSPDAPPTSAGHDLEKIRPGVELAARYALEQRLIPAVPDIPSLFVTVPDRGRSGAAVAS